MKILISHAQNILAEGGADRFAREIALILSKNGHNVSFMQRGENWKDYNWKGIKLCTYPKANMFPGFGWIYIPFLRKNIKKKLKDIKEKQGDFDFIFCINSITNEFVLDNFKNTKIILRIPALEKSEVLHTWKDRTLKQKIVGKILQRYEKKAVTNLRNNLVVNSKKVLSLLDKYYPNHANAFVVYNGINKNKFKKSKLKRKNKVICISRLSPEKNLSKLLSVVETSNQEYMLELYGNGRLKEKLQKQINNMRLNKKIKIKGYSKDIQNKLKESKIMVFPTKHEAFGNVIIEAFACGVPVIAFKPDGKNIITASDEIIENGKTGFLVKDEKEMAEKIDLLLKDDELRKKMGKAARKEAEKYSWEKTAKKILDVVKSIRKF